MFWRPCHCPKRLLLPPWREYLQGIYLFFFLVINNYALYLVKRSTCGIFSDLDQNYRMKMQLNWRFDPTMLKCGCDLVNTGILSPGWFLRRGIVHLFTCQVACTVIKHWRNYRLDSPRDLALCGLGVVKRL